MGLSAIVKKDTGKVKHSIGKFVDGEVVKIPDIPVAKRIEIVEEHGLIYLLRYNEKEVCIADTMHFSIEEAKSQALFEYGIEDAEWT